MRKALLFLLLVSGICHAQTYDDYCRNGSLFYANGKYEEAIRNFNIAISMDSIHGNPYLGRAEVEDKMDEYEAAMADYTRYMALSRDSIDGCMWRADMEYRTKHYPQALADCNASLRIKPDLSSAYGIRGDIKFALKDYKGAVADYDSALIADTIVMYKYFFHRAAVKYMLMDYAGGSRDKKKGEYFAKFAPAPMVADAHPAVSKAKPVATDAHPVAAKPKTVPIKPKPVALDTQQLVAKAKPVATDAHPVAAKPKPVAVDTQHIVTKAKPATTETHPVAVKPKPAVVDAHPVAAKPRAEKAEPKVVAEPLFKNKWLEGFERDSIFTQLKLSRAIATESDKAPLYAARGLIAQRQGRTADACVDFKTAKEMGYTEAEDMIKAYCK